ncbi:MAG: hypothetical protein JW808_00440, partial [Victivallales bacterium]|nr:hypothetical protein [Victivallales bacterium]
QNGHLSASNLTGLSFCEEFRVHAPDVWVYASDHRPLVVVIDAVEKPDWTEEEINVFFRDGVYGKVD